MQQKLYQNSDFSALKCVQNNQTILICISKCQHYPFKCQIQSCQCTKNHNDCSFAIFKTIIDKIEKNRRVVSKYVNQSFQEYDKVLEEMIDYISLMRERAFKLKQYYGMTEMEISLIENLGQMNFKKINGRILNHIINNSKKDDRKFIKGKESIREYWTQNKIKFQQISKKIQQNCFNREQLKLNQIQINLINKWMQQNTKRKVSQMTSIFRASQHDFLCSQFHQNCDKYQNTLVLIKTNFNKVIGGFNPLSWRAQEGKQYAYKEDTTKSAFIFSLSQKQKYNCTVYQSAIQTGCRLGPCFGGYFNQQENQSYQNDIFISDESHRDSGCQSYFPISYNIDDKYKYQQKSQEIFIGNKDEVFFNTVQYEVYSVKFR